MHPELPRMVRAARGAGHPVEVITNGLLLDETVAKQLVDADVAQVTVSIDGGDLGTYADARGCDLDQAVSGLSRVLKARLVSRKQFPIGVAFVLSRRNVASLPVLIDTTGRMGVDFILVSNVVPHTEEMAREALWLRAAWSAAFASDSWKPRLKLAPIDLEEATRAVAEHVARMGPTFPPPALGDGATARRCRFVHEGMAAVSWDGRVAPCLSLLRSHPEYVAGRVKDVVRHEVGNVDEMSLPAIWAQEEYRSFRTRVRAFNFPGCFTCGGCPLTENNQADCFGNPAPTCGECLWAYGLVQCP
jgi:MoaA/NifB/PqqE/SkfB family radical SAM enzyme